jgi:hypothetical protein
MFIRLSLKTIDYTTQRSRVGAARNPIIFSGGAVPLCNSSSDGSPSGLGF